MNHTPTTESEATTRARSTDYALDPDLAHYASQVAKALAALDPCKPPYGGEFYVLEVRLAYDGSPVPVRITPDEHGEYTISIRVEDADASADVEAS